MVGVGHGLARLHPVLGYFLVGAGSVDPEAPPAGRADGWEMATIACFCRSKA